MVLSMGSSVLPTNNLSEISESDIVISEMEEGMMNDASDLYEISDMSTEEEELLRQRIEVLENYNQALEKKVTRINTSQKGTKRRTNSSRPHVTKNTPAEPLPNLIIIDDVDDEAPYAIFSKIRGKKSHKHSKRSHSDKRLNHKHTKRKTVIAKSFTNIEVSSSESDESHENSAKHKLILKEAIAISKTKTEQTSLKKRLMHIMNDSRLLLNYNPTLQQQVVEKPDQIEIGEITDSNNDCEIVECPKDVEVLETPNDVIDTVICSSDDDAETLRQLALKSKTKRKASDDEDVDILRQLALNSKMGKANENKNAEEELKETSLNAEPVQDSLTLPATGETDEHVTLAQHNCEDAKVVESEDSDTVELRLIALKSAMLKKAMERKKFRKETNRRRLRSKRMSLSIFSDNEFDSVDLLSHRSNDNYTDVETIDMEIDNEMTKSAIIETQIQSPADIYYHSQNSLPSGNLLNEARFPTPEVNVNQYMPDGYQHYNNTDYICDKPASKDANYANLSDKVIRKEENLDEDEDILRANLLNSIASSHSLEFAERSVKIPSPIVPSVNNVKNVDYLDSKLIIQLGESDSGSECETTKNLKLMHHKLMEQQDFQHNLDAYLKTARSKFEKKAPDIEKPNRTSPPKKQTPMAVRHLPKSDQQEYRQLVKRMSELERARSARQALQESGQRAKVPPSTVPIPSSLIAVPTPSSVVPPSPIPNKRIIVDSPITHKPSSMTIGRSFKMITDENAPSGVDIQLDISRQKITNQMRVVEQLQNKGKGLRQQTEALTAQLKAVTTALRGSQLALNNNHRLLHTAYRNLVKLKQQHHILNNRKNIIPKSKSNKYLAITIQQNVDRHATSTPLVTNTLVNKDVENKQIVDGRIQQKPSTASNKPAASTEPQIKLRDSENALIQPARITNSIPIENIVTLPVKEPTDIAKKKVRTLECEETSLETKSKRLKKDSDFSATIDNVDTQIVNDNCESVLDVKKTANSKDNKSDDLHTLTEKENMNPEMKESNTKGLSDHTELCSVSVDAADSDVIKLEVCTANDLMPDEGGQMSLQVKNGSSGDVESDLLVVENDKNIPENVTKKCVLTELPSNAKSKMSDFNTEYKSPLQFLQNENGRSEDIQAFFCPFEIGGHCKDPECKYFHPRTQQI